MMNSGGFSPSSFYSEERQVGARKMEHMNGYLGLKSDGMLRTGGVPSSPLERVPLDAQMSNGFALPNNFVNHGSNINISLGKRFIGSERAASRSLPNAVDRDVTAKKNLNKDSASYLFDGDKVNFMGAQHENGLFSSSLSDLFLQNLKVSSNNAAAYANSVAANGVVDSHYEEDEEALESLKELEAKTIGNLLPDDDDLLSGVTDNIIRTGNGEDTEDLDLFSSVGGLELGDDSFSQRNFENGDMNYKNGGDHPSRTLFVRNIDSSVEDSELQMLFEQYGDIRTMYTACKLRGFVMVSYYDIRSACNAMKALQNKLLMCRKLDIHFSIPKENALETDIDQGALVVLNLDQSVSNDEFRGIFGAYGEIKEIRDVPRSSHHKFIEFYDTRAAEAALCALSTSDISGKQIKLEPSRPVGSKSLLQPFIPEQEKCGLQLQYHSPSNNFATGFSGTNGTMLGPLSTNGHISSIPDIVLHPAVSSTLSNNIPSRARVGGSNHLPHSLPEYQDGLANRHPFSSSNNIATNMSPRLPHMIDGQQFRRVNSNGQAIDMTEVFSSSGNGSRHFVWANSHQPQPQPIMWPSSPSFANGMHGTHTQQLHAVPRAPSHMLNTILPLTDHHVGSAPSVNPSLWDGRHAYVGESPDASVFHAGSLGNMRISGNSPHPMEFAPHNMFTGGSYTDMHIPSKNVGLHSHNPRPTIFPARSQIHPMMTSLDSPNERTRNRRNEGSASQPDNKKQFELDLDRIMRGEDKRTTLMIKNIPNKYTSKMLLAAIDERHKGTYDFIYLPIDFKNKCNVGYAFINMTDPSLIVPFYETFNGKKWEKFNSEKVATLAYARIQGRAALIAHFQNSSLMNEDKRCRPILFHTEGPNAGDQVPFPMGSNIRPRLGKTRTSTSEENINQVTGEDYFNGDSSSGSGKDSD